MSARLSLALSLIRWGLKLTIEEQFFIRALIRFYDERGWDWGLAVEFLCHKYNQPK